MDLRVQLALGRDMGKYVGGLPSAAVVGGGPIGEPVDVGLSGEEDGVEEGEVEVVEERERHAMMECLRSADWMSGHDGCAFEVLGAEWVPVRFFCPYFFFTDYLTLFFGRGELLDRSDCATVHSA